jgi:hypothetical protein
MTEYTVERGQYDPTRSFIVCEVHGAIAEATSPEQIKESWHRHLFLWHGGSL